MKHMTHAAIVKSGNAWQAVTFDTAEEATNHGTHFGLRAALREHGGHISDSATGDLFVVEVVDGGSL